jgi:hypothetical protein
MPALGSAAYFAPKLVCALALTPPLTLADAPVEDLHEYLAMLRQTLTQAGVPAAEVAGAAGPPPHPYDEREEKWGLRGGASSPTRSTLSVTDNSDAESFSSACHVAVSWGACGQAGLLLQFEVGVGRWGLGGLGERCVGGVQN